ncbi:hypothetical protein B0H19DRAFT_1151172, partial [Mycena capillaripes]
MRRCFTMVSVSIWNKYSLLILQIDLIPFKYFVDLQHSHFSKVYTYGHCAANNHFYFTFRRYL